VYKDVYRCVQMCTRKNGAAIKEFFDVYKMCTDVYGGVFFDVYKMCTDVYRWSFLMCTRLTPSMCTRKKSVCAVKYMGNSMYKVFHRYVQ
jgi:hypothetical protein